MMLHGLIPLKGTSRILRCTARESDFFSNVIGTGQGAEFNRCAFSFTLQRLALCGTIEVVICRRALAITETKRGR